VTESTAPSDGGLPTLVVAAGIFPDEPRILASYEGRCVVRFADLSTPELITAATEGADGVVIATNLLDHSRVTSLGPGVRVIGRAGVGLDAIDLGAAGELGVGVINQPAYGALEVATHAVAMLLSLQRKLASSDRYVRDGWSGPMAIAPMAPLDEVTLGLVGCGRIGSETARMLRPIVKRVVVFDPFAAELPAFVERADDLDALLAQSELLSVHSPLTPQTRGLIGARELALLPVGAVVVNVARGGILDEDALAALLVSGHLGGAGLDVFADEPVPVDSLIASAPNTVFSPHVAAYSERSSWRLASWTIDDVLTWLASGTIVHGNVVVAGHPRT
jgi:D-3-phosphoglycerate dehydrogenase